MSATVVVLLLCVPLVLDLLRAPCYYSVLSLGKLASGHSPGTRRRVPGECSQPIRRRVMQLVQRDVEEEAPPPLWELYTVGKMPEHTSPVQGDDHASALQPIVAELNPPLQECFLRGGDVMQIIGFAGGNRAASWRALG